MYCQTWMLLNGIDGTMILYHASCEEDPNLPWPAVTKQDLMDGEKEGAFIIRRKDGTQYMVDFSRNSQEQMPSCSCKDWTRWHIPCKHFFAVFRLRQAWCWDALLQTYRDSVHTYQQSRMPLMHTLPSSVSHNAEDTPQPIPDFSGEVETTPGSERSLQASLQQQIPVKVRWYL